MSNQGLGSGDVKSDSEGDVDSMHNEPDLACNPPINSNSSTHDSESQETDNLTHKWDRTQPSAMSGGGPLFGSFMSMGSPAAAVMGQHQAAASWLGGAAGAAGAGPTSSGNKRGRNLSSDTMVEDILGQICQEMNKLSTGSSTEQSNADKVNAFIQVLQCSLEEATFYLDSSGWDVETAVVLWLDMGQQQNNSRQQSQQPTNRHSYQRRTWRPIQVFIEGLDPAWSARVSRRTGQVYFLHLESGHTQSEVPDGFADDDTERERTAKQFQARMVDLGSQDMVDLSEATEESNGLELGISEQQQAQMDVHTVGITPVLHGSFEDFSSNMAVTTDKTNHEEDEDSGAEADVEDF